MVVEYLTTMKALTIKKLSRNRQKFEIFFHWKKLTCSTMWFKCGSSVEIPWKNCGSRVPQFFPFPRRGTEDECGISVVTVWNQNVELVWKLCGISVIIIKHIELTLCGTSVEF